MAVTPKLGITLLDAGGSQKETLIDNAFNILDNAITKRQMVLVLMEGVTPSLGAQVVEIPVPYSPVDGVTSVTWNVRRINARVAGATTGAGFSVTFEKSTAVGAFSAVTIGTVTMPTTTNEASVTASLGTVASGNKIRANVTALGGATSLTLSIELGEA